MTEIQGLSGARGQALLPAAVLSRRDVAPRRREVDDPEAEVERFQTVRRGYAEELDALYEKTLAETGAEAADIIKAYAVIARDDFFFKKTIRQVRTGGINADYALALERDKVCEKFAAMEDPYMKARADDIRNVCGELIRRMNGVSPDIRLSGDAPVILVAEDLMPEDTIRIDKRRLGGFVTERGASPPTRSFWPRPWASRPWWVRPASWRRWAPGASSTWTAARAGPWRTRTRPPARHF